MNWNGIINVVWSILNSPAGITALAALLLWGLNKLYASKPAWKAYEGSIISAVKWAEKEIPDDTPNKSLQRLDAALRWVVHIYYKAHGKEPDAKLKRQLKEGIQIKHAELEATGALSKAGKVAALLLLSMMVCLGGCNGQYIIAAPGSGPVSVAGSNSQGYSDKGLETTQELKIACPDVQACSPVSATQPATEAEDDEVGD